MVPALVLAANVGFSLEIVTLSLGFWASAVAKEPLALSLGVKLGDMLVYIQVAIEVNVLQVLLLCSALESLDEEYLFSAILEWEGLLVKPVVVRVQLEVVMGLL